MNVLNPDFRPDPAIPSHYRAKSWPELLDELHAEFQPVGIFERIYLRDIAVLTARIDHLRCIQSGVHSYHMYRLSHQSGEGPTSEPDLARGSQHTQEWTRDPNELATISKIVAGLAGFDALNLGQVGGAFERLLGMAYTERLEIFAELDRIIMEVMRQRNELIGLFEKIGSPSKLTDALEALASNARLLRPPAQDL